MVITGAHAILAKRGEGSYDQAEAVLDAILPQVTTVTELPQVAIALTTPEPHGYPVGIFWMGRNAYYLNTGEVIPKSTLAHLLACGPLTVVWQP